jgi:hypothetical protein
MNIRKIGVTSSVCISLVIMGFTLREANKKVTLDIQPTVLPVQLVSETVCDIIEYNPIIVTNQYKDFIIHIGFTESGNDYTKVNTLGYVGRYQFGKSTLKTLKYRGSLEYFLSNPELQDEYMLKNLKSNKRRLQKYIDKYSGTIINGTSITESGILAAAHLGGVGSVRRYFKRGEVTKDAYGTSITNYMTKFSGYELKLS